MKTKEKECVQYALHAYDTFWDYYKRTLDERNQILNNYIVIVGIPVSIIGIVAEKVKDEISYYTYWIVLALAIVLAFGFIIYDAYIVESFISERYLKKIKYITEYLIQHYDKQYRKVFSETYSLDDLFLNRKESLKHRLRKGFLVIIINTVIIIGIICLLYLNHVKWYHIFLSIIVSVVIHTAIFYYHKKNEV